MKLRNLLLISILLIAALGMGNKNIKGEKAMVDVKQLAPDIKFTDLAGNPVLLSSFKGKVIFLNFWATWCPPCRGEMPSLEKLHEKMKGKAFVILAISIGENKLKVANFIKENKYSFPVYLDTDNQAADVYKVSGIPTNFLIDKDGYVMFRESGSRDWASAEIQKQIEHLLK